MKKLLIAPHVHLNGTSQESLANAYADAVTAVGKALEALYETAPNARDFYPAMDRYKQAQLEHSARVEKLRSVQAELAALAIAVDERQDQAGID